MTEERHDHEQDDHEGEPQGDGLGKALKAEREQRKAAEKRARELEGRITELEGAEVRRKVAAAKGLSEAQAKHLRGDDEEALIAHADELLQAFGGEEESQEDDIRRAPRERLRPGAAPGATPDESDSDIAARIVGD